MNVKNKTSMSENYSYIFNNLKLKWEKNGGKICTIAGTTGLFLTGLHASRKTYLIHDELVENGKRIEEAKKHISGEKSLTRYFRIAKEVGKVSLSTGKHYIPDLIGGGISAYTNAKGWQHEHNHYQQAANMVGILAASFMNYRRNVIAEEGVEADRRYFNTKREDRGVHEATLEDGTKVISSGNGQDGDNILVDLDPSTLRIKYSKETTPSVWSPSHALRIINLRDIVNRINKKLINNGHYYVNDVRREFFGGKGDSETGGMFGRIWDPGNPEHPEYGRLVNLHYEDDEDFMFGRKDWCWIEIEIDLIPLFESMAIKKKRDQDRGYFTPVEPVY